MADGEPYYLSSFIDVDLWNTAEWRGTKFLVDLKSSLPPLIGFIFNDESAGKEIFAGLKKRLGSHDKFERLRLSIIESDFPGEEPGYIVHLGSDLKRAIASADAQAPEVKRLAIISRFCRIYSDPGESSLDEFREAYAAHQRYGILPVTGQAPALQPEYELAIEKRIIHLRRVEEISGKNDPDAALVSR